MVKSDEQELKSDESELIKAARRPPTTRPRRPIGRREVTITAKTLSPSSTVSPAAILVGIATIPF